MFADDLATQRYYTKDIHYINGSVQDCSNSIANALELLH